MTENFKKLIKSYEVLGLTPGQASLNDIQGAYRDLVKVWHPDRFANDPKLQHKAQEKMKEINEAYQTIQDAQENPTKYDMDEGGYYGETGYQEAEVINEEEAQQSPNSTPPPSNNPKNNDQPVSPSVGVLTAERWYSFLPRVLPLYGAYTVQKQFDDLWSRLIAGLIVFGILFAVVEIIVFACKKAGVIRIAFYCVVIFLSLLVGQLIYTSYEGGTATYAECMKAYGNKTTSRIAAQVISAACNNIVRGNKTNYNGCIISSMPDASNDMVARAIIQECRKKPRPTLDEIFGTSPPAPSTSPKPSLNEIDKIFDKAFNISPQPSLDEVFDKAFGVTPLGKISVYTDIPSGNIDIYIDDEYIGKTTSYFPDGVSPICGQEGTVSRSLSAASHRLSARHSDGTTWETTVNIQEGGCQLQLLTRK